MARRRAVADGGAAAESLALAVRLARAAYDKKAEDIVVLDLRGVSPVTDAFVIVTANNPRLMGAVAEAAEEAAAEMGVRLFGSEGRGGARWVVLDFVDVVVHVFDAPFRRLYDLELLWGDAPRVPWEEAADRT